MQMQMQKQKPKIVSDCQVASAEWDRVMADVGNVDAFDYNTLAAYCTFYAEYIFAKQSEKDTGGPIVRVNGTTKENPWREIAAQSLQQMTILSDILKTSPKSALSVVMQKHR